MRLFVGREVIPPTTRAAQRARASVSRKVKTGARPHAQDGATLPGATEATSRIRVPGRAEPPQLEMELAMAKSKMLTLAAPLAALFLAGCQSPQQMLADEQGAAVQTAANRGRFEMNCPQATGMVLSQNLLQPVLWGGMERAEYTVGVEGCGQRRTYVVICQLGSPSCFAGQARY